MPGRTISLTVLGSGSCVPRVRRASASYLVQHGETSLLVDMGSGSLRRLVEFGFPWSKLDGVLLTHFHMDHVADLPALLFAFQNAPGLTRQRELLLAGPVGLEGVLHGLADTFGRWVLDPGVPVRMVELPGEDLVLGELEISARPVHHSRNALGYRLEACGRVLTLSGDTGVCDGLVWLARGADVAVFECANADQPPVESHLTPEEAGAVAEEAGVNKLVLSHIYPAGDEVDLVGRARRTFNGEITVAEDLMTIWLSCRF
ncbi:MAG: ribonuclease Z [Calditrichaeota bacterium]|nr:ribonuclease Z [Calditrichota bacterium]